ncbi:MAG: hypothetical protein LBR50_01615 [Tannerella sp.]|jgi:hypothetical protein|nr:hypothetical protein [Tannerella sp.]
MCQTKNKTKKLPKCPTKETDNGKFVDLDNTLDDVAKALVKADLVIILDESDYKKWDEFVEAWADNEKWPLVVRSSTLSNSKDRGKRETEVDRRKIIFKDNTPAHQMFVNAYKKKDVPTNYEDALKGSLVSSKKWYVAHVEPVIQGKQTKITERKLEDIKGIHTRLLKPSNIILIPLEYKGLGEVPGFLDKIKTQYEASIAESKKRKLEDRASIPDCLNRAKIIINPNI